MSKLPPSWSLLLGNKEYTKNLKELQDNGNNKLKEEIVNNLPDPIIIVPKIEGNKIKNSDIKSNFTNKMDYDYKTRGKKVKSGENKVLPYIIKASSDPKFNNDVVSLPYGITNYYNNIREYNNNLKNTELDESVLIKNNMYYNKTDPLLGLKYVTSKSDYNNFVTENNRDPYLEPMVPVLENKKKSLIIKT